MVYRLCVTRLMRAQSTFLKTSDRKMRINTIVEQENMNSITFFNTYLLSKKVSKNKRLKVKEFNKAGY